MVPRDFRYRWLHYLFLAACVAMLVWLGFELILTYH
jgi:hypothetical protein